MLCEVVTGKHVSAPLENVKIDYDHEKKPDEANYL
jgi:hypothetical protein